MHSNTLGRSGRSLIRFFLSRNIRCVRSLAGPLFLALIVIPIAVSVWLHAQANASLRVGIALPPGNRTVGLPAIAEGLSSEALVTLSLNGRVLPQLAQAWSRSKDGYEWEFQLPSNVRLHDGRAADSSVVADLLRRALREPAFAVLHPKLHDSVDIQVKGGQTLVLRSVSPRVLVIDELADVRLTTGGTDAGIGPFVIDALSAETLRAHGFQEYFKGAPALNHISFVVYRSQRSAWSGLMRGEIDALYELSREAVEFVENGSRLRLRSFLRPYVSGLVFNITRPQFRDAALRRALVEAIDRAEIIRSAYRGHAVPADGPLFPEHWSRPFTPITTHSGPTKQHALSLLPVQTSPGLMPARVRFRCLVPAFETQPFERIALLLQKQLYSSGVDLQLEMVSVPELLKRLPAGDFDAVLMEFFGATPSWLRFFWHSRTAGFPSLPNTGYAAADSELDAVDGATSEEELKRALNALQAKMVEDPPAIFLAWPEVSRAVSNRFDVPVEPGRDIMGANLRLWRPARQP